MSHITRALITLTLLVGGVAWWNVKAAGEPQLNTITPDHGTFNDTIRLTGLNFTGSNVVDWGFGRTTLDASGAPGGEQTLTPDFRLNIGGPECDGGLDGEGNPIDLCPDPVPLIGGQEGGIVTINVSNENGTSNAAQFFLMRNSSTCYDSSVPAVVACTSAACDVGNCIVPTPTPTPSPTATPTSGPTPTPIVITKIVEVEKADNGGGGGGAPQSGSATAGQGQVAGTSTRSVAPSAEDKAAPDYIPNNVVPAVVQKLYQQVYRKAITHCSSDYWKTRIRGEGLWRESEVLAKMLWQRQHLRDPVYGSCLKQAGGVAGATAGGKITSADISRLFKATHGGVNPTPAQNQYWISRMADKPAEAAMLGAMQWHALNGTGY